METRTMRVRCKLGSHHMIMVPCRPCQRGSGGHLLMMMPSKSAVAVICGWPRSSHRHWWSC